MAYPSLLGHIQLDYLFLWICRSLYSFFLSLSFFFFCVWPTPRSGFPGVSDGKLSACNAGEADSIPGSERSPGKAHGNPLQYSCLENSMDRGICWVTVHGSQGVRHN